MNRSAPFRRADAALLVLLALVGTWVGHNAVYLASNGGGVLQQLTSPVHVYMIPAGAALLAIALAGGMAWASALARLRAHLILLNRGLRRPGRSEGPAAPPTDGPNPRTADVVSVWLTLTFLQLILYVAQENLEARAVHAPLQGIAVVTGVHWVAVPLHALLALGLAALAVGGRRTTARLERAVRTLARLVDQVAGRRTAAAAPPPTDDTTIAVTPHQRWGSCRWQRPPPFVAA